MYSLALNPFGILTMILLSIEKLTLIILIICLLIGRGQSISKWDRGEEGTAELQMLFDPDLAKEHVSLNDNHGMKAFLVVLPPCLENLEEE